MRCIRLDKECSPHQSRQGKRKHTRLTAERRPSSASVASSSAAGIRSCPSPGGIARRASLPSDVTNPSNGASSSLNNQAQLIDMLESTNLQQLSSNLNVYNGLTERLYQNHNALQGGGGSGNAAAALLGPAAASSPQRTERDSQLAFLLSRLLGDKANTMPPQDLLAHADLLRNMDPAKLNMMINQLESNNSRVDVVVNKYNLNAVAAAGSSTQPNLLGNVGAQQPSAAALLMLAGTNGSVAHGNGGQDNFAKVNNFVNSGASANVMGYNGGGGSGSVGRRYSAHDQSSSPMITGSTQMMAGTGAHEQQLGRRSTMPDELLGRNQAGGGDAAAAYPMSGAVATSESLLKKQKKAHLLPNDSKAKPPAHLQYPPISLIPSSNDKSNARAAPPTKSNVPPPHPNNSDENSNGLSRSSSTANFMTPEDTIGQHIARVCAKHAGQKILSLKNHYGLQCQIREWISISLARRSFALLAKASNLANRCGIHMDRILCGVADEDDHQYAVGSRMNYLLATLLEPRAQQTLPIHERHMLRPRLPTELLSVVGCQNCPTFRESEMRNRWIIIRETHRGVTQFYCSPAFERNVLSWTHVSQIYEDNLADINSLIFVRDDFRKFLACNAHQISLHSVGGMPPKPVRAFNTKIRLLGRQWGQAKYDDPSWCRINKEMIANVQDGNAVTLEMDLRFVSFPTMDKTTYYLEFFHHSAGGSSARGSEASWTRNLSDDSLHKTGADAAQQSVIIQNAENVEMEGPGGPGGKEAPPAFDDIIDSEDWIGINDVLASGDIDDLITALLD